MLKTSQVYCFMESQFGANPSAHLTQSLPDILSFPVLGSKTQTLNLWMMRQVLYHSATAIIHLSLHLNIIKEARL